MSSYALMTNTGRNKEAAALANGTSLEITEIAWGDGDRFPSGGETTLLNERGRKLVQGTGLVDDTLNTAFFEILLDANEGPFVIREAGLFDADGDLIAIAKYDPPVNKPKDSVTALIRINVVFSDLENLILKVQSTDAYVPVERRVKAGTGLVGGGDLSADRSFAVVFSSEAEALAGKRNDTAMSPATVAAKINIAAPAGAVMAFAMSSPPEGWLECNGAALSRTSYAALFAAIGTTHGAGNGTTFRLPDLRGEFLRGWDHGRALDAGRVFGSMQADAMQEHEHYIRGQGTEYDKVVALEDGNNSRPFAPGADGSSVYDRGDVYIRVAGIKTGNKAAETRPRNMALMFCIKY